MKKILLFFTTLSIVFSCTKAPAPSGQEEKKDVVNEPAREQYNGFVKYTVDEITDNLFMINHDWMLVTGGTESSFNTMTASWGGFGTVWEKPVAFMTIRDTRYTFGFLQKEPVYTISFYDESYKDKLQDLGSRSGKDTEKIKESGLTPLAMPSGAVAFKEAKMIIECRKLFSQPINPKYMTDKELAGKWYNPKEPGTHYIFFGEIIGVWKKQ